MGVELNFINEPQPEPVTIESTLPEPKPDTVKYGRMEHRIDSRGDEVECTSEADSWCRHIPLCDTEYWSITGCQKHNEEHRPQPGQDCWLIQWVNAVGLQDSYIEPDELRDVKPGAHVHIEYEEDYAVWEYEQRANNEDDE